VRFASIGSGSEGNGLVVEAGTTRVLIDCGFGVRDTAARLERIAHQHRHDCEQTEQRQRIEPRHAATVADFDCRPRADVGRGLPTWGPWNHEAAGRFEPAAAGLHRMRGAR